MSVSSPGESPFADERELRAAVHVAVEHALDRVLDSRDRELTELEAEKLAYLVVDEFDLDITYSWYIAGACTAVTRGPTAERGPSGPSPPTLTDDERRVVFGDVTVEVGGDRTQQFTDYLTSETLFAGYELRDVWYTGRHEFLSDFYEARAPERFTDAYLAATEIRRHLMELGDDRRADSNASLSQFGVGEQPLLDDEREEAFRHTVSELHLALARDDDLAETTAAVTEGTDLIERALDRLTRVEPSTSEQWDLIEELSEFFFYAVWRFPALVISVQTATGPNAAALRAEHLQKREGFEQTIERKRVDLHSRLADANLLPTVKESSSSNIGIEYEISLSEE